MQLLYILLIIIVILSCNENKPNKRYTYKTIKIGDYIVKGNVDSDTLYDGTVQYYLNDTLVELKTFINGISNGKVISYFTNGKIKQTGFDRNGVFEGEVAQFDTSGIIIRKQYYYRGRLMGPQYFYDSLGNPTEYYFLNFENDILCKLRYKSDKIEVEDGSLLYPTFSNLNKNGKDFVRVFTYLHRPDKLNCKYSICLVDNINADNISTIEAINSVDFYYEKDYPVIPEKYYCIKLDLFDSIQNKGKVVMQIFK